jgi:hypothetical protein
MKIYVRANSDKPLLNKISTEWEDIENGISFIIRSDAGEVIYEQVFDYSDVDPDAVYDSALDMALAALQLKYTLSDEVIAELTSPEP